MEAHGKDALSLLINALPRSCQFACRLPSSRRLRKKRVAILSVLFIVAVAAGAWVFFFWLAPRTSGPLRQEVYVWQRAWTQPVRDAVSQHATNFAEIAVLKAEISWKDKQPQLTRGGGLRNAEPRRGGPSVSRCGSGLTPGRFFRRGIH
jgi:hypothetical protein